MAERSRRPERYSLRLPERYARTAAASRASLQASLPVGYDNAARLGEALGRVRTPAEVRFCSTRTRSLHSFAKCL